MITQPYETNKTGEVTWLSLHHPEVTLTDITRLQMTDTGYNEVWYTFPPLDDLDELLKEYEEYYAPFIEKMRKVNKLNINLTKKK